MQTIISVKPSHPDWVYRQTAVPLNGIYNTPMYVVRIDMEGRQGPGYAGTHGWQVRYRKPWRLFSDSAFDTPRRKGTPKDSLKEALIYLESIWVGKRPQTLLPEKASKQVPTGLPGVRLIWRKKRTRAAWECRVRVDKLNGRPLASIYVGTSNTVTQARLKAAVAEGVALRLEYLQSQNVRLPPVGAFDEKRAWLECPST